jgi:hypothetical protein
VWQKNLGGAIQDVANSIWQTTDSGFIVAGKSESTIVNGNPTGNHGHHDFWVAKLDADGNSIWQKSLGGLKEDAAFSVQQTIDSGFVIAGWSGSTDGDVTGNHGIRDYWVVKLKGEIQSGIAPVSITPISIYPNPVQNQLTIDLGTETNDKTIVVYDIQGRRFGLTTILNGNKAQLNTEQLPDGFYFLQLINNKTGQIEEGKFVKEE